MQLHSTLEGRAGAFRLRGAAWEVNPLTFRGFLYLIPIRGGDGGRHRVVEAAGDSVWKLLDALSEQVTSAAGGTVERLDAHAVAAKRSLRAVSTRDSSRETVA
jgi:hypothetical protein